MSYSIIQQKFVGKMSQVSRKYATKTAEMIAFFLVAVMRDKEFCTKCFIVVAILKISLFYNKKTI